MKLDEAELRRISLQEDNEEDNEVQEEIQVDLRYVQLLFFVVFNAFLRTVLEICPNESGGFTKYGGGFIYRENESLPQSLLAMMKNLKMVPVFVRQLIDEILSVTVSF